MQESIKTNKNLLVNRYILNIILFTLISFLTPSLLLVGLLGNNPTNWWQSISAAYYCNTKQLYIVFMGSIAMFLLFFDNIIYNLSGLTIIGILLFPTYEEPLNISKSSLVGIFKLPIEVSGTIHIIFNFILLLFIIALVIKTVKDSKNYKLLLLALPIFCSVLLILIETCLHTQGNWSFHWSTIISEWMLFQTAGLIFFFRR